jgi:hypothetical protein
MAKNFKVEIKSDSIKHANISKYKGGYNFASVTSKVADDEYMSVHYEWKDSNGIPEFAMSVMDVMKSINKDSASITNEDIDVLERAAEYLKDFASKNKKEE